MSDPARYLRVIDDRYMPVRDERGRLLGCINKPPDDAPFVGEFPILSALQACVLVNLGAGQRPQTLNGFMPYDDADADLSIPVADDNETDLAEGV